MPERLPLQAGVARSWLIALASLAKAVVAVQLWLVALASLAKAVAAARLWLVAFATLAKAVVAVQLWLVAFASLAKGRRRADMALSAMPGPGARGGAGRHGTLLLSVLVLFLFLLR